MKLLEFFTKNIIQKINLFIIIKWLQDVKLQDALKDQKPPDVVQDALKDQRPPDVVQDALKDQRPPDVVQDVEVQDVEVQDVEVQNQRNVLIHH